jgi:2-polyprenyl-3-methyl-5-hydroxy-6-metoxy-1,4-benzoquinol methylase
MSLITDVSRRRLQPEIMDQPELDEGRHLHALRSMARINLVSLTSSAFWRPLRALAKELNRPPRVLDVASGGGDVAINLWRRGQRADLKFEIEGCDISPRAAGFAERRAQSQKAPVHFFVHDVVSQGVPEGYDAVICSLFLHHLEDDQAEGVLRAMEHSANRLVILSDLVRCAPGLALAHLACHALTRCDVVHFDGPRSVEGAFTLAEVRALAKRAGLQNARVKAVWPFRYVLTWHREG